MAKRKESPLINESLTHREKWERRKEMAEKVKKGAQPERVANEYGVSVATVRNACRENFVASEPKRIGRPPGPGLKTSSVLLAIKVLRELMRGGTQADVARRLDTTRQRVHQIAQMADDEKLWKAAEEFDGWVYEE